MQKIISRFLMLLIVVMGSVAIAQAQSLTPREGVVRIKLQDDVAKSVGKSVRTATNGVLSTGVQSLEDRKSVV